MLGKQEKYSISFLLLYCQSHYLIRLVKWFLGKLIAAAAERIITYQGPGHQADDSKIQNFDSRKVWYFRVL